MQRLTRWGNSVGVRLPKSVLEAAGLNEGDYCQVRLLDCKRGLNTLLI
jgi:antitoxin MazE